VQHHLQHGLGSGIAADPKFGVNKT
jgi:hypothetical protein